MSIRSGSRRLLDRPPPSRSSLQWDGYSLKGRSRDSNEDRFEAAPWPPQAGSGGAFLVVADGIGGQPAGEFASQLATSSMILSLEHVDPRSKLRILENRLRRAVTEAHLEILADGSNHHDREGMGTTLTAALIHGSFVTVVHVGDSRCYRFRKGVLTPLTLDHTLERVMRETRALLPGAVGSSPCKHSLWNYLGGSRDNFPDPFISTSRLERGDLLLLTTDGITNVFPDADLSGVLARGGDAKAVCRRLVGMARGRGSGDDATALLARVGVAPVPRDLRLA